MFGWEFPPHISGGLGTACYGLTKGMASLPGMDILFVVPKAYGDEEKESIELNSAEQYKITTSYKDNEEILRRINFLTVKSGLVPYTTIQEYEQYQRQHKHSDYHQISTHFSGHIPFTGKYGPGLLQEIANYALVANTIAQNNSFDIIHAHDWLTYPAGIAAHKASGKPLVIHVHATDFDRSGGNVNPQVYQIEKEGMEASHKIITVSDRTKKMVIEQYGISPDKVITVHNAVDPLPQGKKFTTKKGFEEKVVTFLGRITHQKGPEYFIEAAYQVLQKMDNVKFVMAGSGDMLDRMISRAAKLGIMDNFHFTGFLKGADVYRLFSISDLYIMPSTSEPFGISPLEAMQSNVPVIISRQSGVAEILKHAIKIDFWDVEAISDAIYSILNNPSIYEMASKYGKMEVDQLKWKDSAIKVEKIYTSVLDSQPLK